MENRKNIVIYTVSESYFVARSIKQLISFGCEIEHVFITTSSSNVSVLALLKKYFRLLYHLKYSDFVKGGYYYLFTAFFAKNRLESILNTANVEFSYVQDINSDEHINYVNRLDDCDCVFFIFNQIAKKSYLLNLKHNCYNLHMGYLPHYRGSNSIFFALAKKENETGVTLHQTVERIDSGKVVGRKKFKLSHESWFENLDTGFFAATELLREFCYGHETIETLNKQNVDEGSYFSTPSISNLKMFYKKFKFF